MLCAHCNDELDPTDHNCCEACDLQVQLRARVAHLEALNSLNLTRIESQRQMIVDLQNARAEDMRQSAERFDH